MKLFSSFPDELKLADIIHVHQKGSTTVINYRSIANYQLPTIDPLVFVLNIVVNILC